MKNKTILTGLGIFISIIGILSLVLELVGIQFGFLSFLSTKSIGALPSFLSKVFMIMGGVLLIVFINHDEEAYDEYLDE